MYKHIFGPVPSRRLGISLGVDMVTPKTCNMNCVFCECGATITLTEKRGIFKNKEEIKKELSQVLKSVTPDYITFSGNGEPTLSLDLGEIINWIKDNYSIKVCVITNSLLLNDDKVIEELKRADLIIPTINTCNDIIFKKINRTSKNSNIEDIKKGLKKLSNSFQGDIYLETFLIENINTSDDDINTLSNFLKTIKFTKLQLNSLARKGTMDWVKEISQEKLQEIKNKFLKNGITNVEIVNEMKEQDVKIEIDKNLFENMKKIREYSEDELKKIYKI